MGAGVLFQVSGGFRVIFPFLILPRVHSFYKQHVSQDTKNVALCLVFQFLLFVVQPF